MKSVITNPTECLRTKKYSLLALFFILIQGCGSYQVAKIPEYPFVDFQANHKVSAAALSPDNTKLVYLSSREKYPSVWIFDLKTQERKKLIDLGRPIIDVEYSPSGDYLVFIADKGGNEKYQIYSYDFKEQKHKRVTYDDNSMNAFCGWSPDGKFISFISDKRERGEFDLYIGKNLDLIPYHSAGKAAPFVKTGHINTCGKFNKQNTQYVFVRFISNLEKEIYLFDFKKDKLSLVSNPNEKATYSSLDWDNDQKSVYTITNQKNDFDYIAKINTSNNEFSVIKKENWDIVEFSIGKNRKVSSYTINEHGYYKIKFFDEVFGEPKDIKLPEGVNRLVTFTNSERALVFSHESSIRAKDYYFHHYRDFKTLKLTESNQSQIPKEQLAEAKLVTFKSFDGLEISGFLYKPIYASEVSRVPAILWVHGGPEDQVIPEFSARMQFFVNRGFALFAPNFRGSSGYGKKFRKLVYKDWGGDHIKDLIEAKKVLVRDPSVITDKVAIVGGSFGGFSVLSTLVQYPKEFYAAVDIFGPSNLFSFIENAPPHWRQGLLEMIGDLTVNKTMLAQRSPLFHLEKIETPLFVIQGANDPRVPKSESDQLVEGLVKLNKTVKYLIFPDEGHGFSKNINQIKAWTEAINFLREKI